MDEPHKFIDGDVEFAFRAGNSTLQCLDRSKFATDTAIGRGGAVKLFFRKRLDVYWVMVQEV